MNSPKIPAARWTGSRKSKSEPGLDGSNRIRQSGAVCKPATRNMKTKGCTVVRWEPSLVKKTPMEMKA
jgi:hypothetical protein